MTEATEASTPLISLQQASMQFGGQRVLHAVDLDVRRGQTVVVIGESGCGKTVLLKLIIGLLRPTVGRALFDGKMLIDLPERELTRGWLKASYRALDSKRTKPWKPWHQLTRATQAKVVSGEVNEYRVELMSTANLFERGHRICLEITSLDLPTGSGFENNCEYVPYHVCSSKTVVHQIYHNEQYPSHLILPVIPKDEAK